MFCIVHSEVRMYNTAADSTLPSVPKKRKVEEPVSEGDASFADGECCVRGFQYFQVQLLEDNRR